MPNPSAKISNNINVTTVRRLASDGHFGDLIMDYNALFGRAARLLWRHKFIWFLGVALGINNLLFSLGWVMAKGSLSPLLLAMQGDSSTPFANGAMPTMPFESLTPEKLFLYGAAGLTAVFIWTILFWIIVTIAEGALIAVVRDDEQGHPVQMGASLRAGWRWLARFAAVDALVFLPWFLLALVLMVIVAAVLIFAIASLTSSTVEMEQVFTTAGGGLLCIIPAVAVMALLGRLTVWYRQLAFRDAALLDHGVKTAVNHPIRLIKANMGALIAMTALLWGLSSVIGGAISLISAASFVFLHNGAWPFVLLDLTAVLLATLLTGILVAFQSIVWSLAYQEWGLGSERIL